MMEADMENIMKMMEQAQALSQLMGGNMESGPANEGQMDFTSIMKAMEMAQMLKGLMPEAADQNPQEAEGAEKDESADPWVKAAKSMEILSFDDVIDTPALKTIKSAIPYLEQQYRRPLGVAVKFIEIQRVLEKYSDHALSIQSTAGGDWRREMLRAIRPNMDDEKKYMIDLLIKIMDIKEISVQMQLLKGAANGESI